MNILRVDIENYEKTEDPTISNNINSDWTINETDLNRIRDMKKNTTKSKKFKKNP